MTKQPALLCPKCHNKVTASDTYCGSCGQQLKGAEAPVEATPAPTSATAAAPAAPVVDPANDSKSSAATTSLILALSGMLLSFFGLFFPLLLFLALVAFIVSIVFGFMGIKSTRRGRAIGGLIVSGLSSVAIIGLFGLFFLAVAICRSPEKYGVEAGDERCSSVQEDLSSRVPSLLELTAPR